MLSFARSGIIFQTGLVTSESILAYSLVTIAANSTSWLGLWNRIALVLSRRERSPLVVERHRRALAFLPGRGLFLLRPIIYLISACVVLILGPTHLIIGLLFDDVHMHPITLILIRQILCSRSLRNS